MTSHIVGHTSSVKSVAFLTDGTLLASGGETVESKAFDFVFCCDVHDYPKVWNAASGKVLREFHDDPPFLNSWVNAVRTGRKLCSNKQGDPLSGLAFASNGKFLVNSLGNIFDSSSGKNLRHLDTKDYSEKMLAAGPSMNVASCVAVNGKGDVAALGISDQTVRLFELAGGGHQVQKLVGHSGPVLAVAFSADGGSVASAGEDNGVTADQVFCQNCFRSESLTRRKRSVYVCKVATLLKTVILKFRG